MGGAWSELDFVAMETSSPILAEKLKSIWSLGGDRWAAPMVAAVCESCVLTDNTLAAISAADKIAFAAPVTLKIEREGLSQHASWSFLVHFVCIKSLQDVQTSTLAIPPGLVTNERAHKQHTAAAAAASKSPSALSIYPGFNAYTNAAGLEQYAGCNNTHTFVHNSPYSSLQETPKNSKDREPSKTRPFNSTADEFSAFYMNAEWP